MKDLANFGVQELNIQEQITLDGGVFNNIIDIVYETMGAASLLCDATIVIAFW